MPTVKFALHQLRLMFHHSEFHHADYAGEEHKVSPRITLAGSACRWLPVPDRWCPRSHSAVRSHGLLPLTFLPHYDTPSRQRPVAMRRETHAQSIVVGLSSLFYTIPAYACTRGTSWHIHTFGTLLYLVVALASMAADGGFASKPWTSGENVLFQGRVQVLDRWTATMGLLYIWGLNAWPLVPMTTSLTAISCLLASLAILRKARQVPVANTWQWVYWQSLWHLVSALATVAFLPECGGLYCLFWSRECRHP